MKRKDHKHFKNILSYKAKQFMLTKTISKKKSLDKLEDGASGFAGGDIEQVIFKKIIYIYLNYIELMISTKKIDDHLKCIMNS